VVVGALHVDGAVEAALPLGQVVGHVGEEVGGVAAALDHHPVLVVPELRGAEPERAVLLVDEPRLAQAADGVLHPPRVVERRLQEELVEADAEAVQVAVLLGAEPRDGEAAHVVHRGGRVVARRRSPCSAASSRAISPM
jgi:hypothetical protein